MASGPTTLSAAHVVGSVIGTRSLSSHFTRVELDVPALGDLDMPREGDTAVGIYFGDGPSWPSSPGRTYTVRVHDPDTARMAVDVYLHGDGIGTVWANSARVGDRVVVAHARSWYRPPPAIDWQLLVADMAALPALARILDAPHEHPTRAVVHVTDRSDLDYLPRRPDVELIALLATGDWESGGDLVRRATECLPAGGRGYCWFAGEARQARAMRRHLRGELGWETNELDVMGYWRRHSAEWDERFAGVGAELYSVYAAALRSGTSEKTALEEFDEALERAGL